MKAIVNLFILDSSRSMTSIKKQIIEGYNTQVSKLQELKDDDIRSFGGLISFSSTYVASNDAESLSPRNALTVHSLAEDIDTIPLLSESSYICDDGTALYDAIGYGIIDLEEKLGQYLTACNVVVTILTDGYENSSHTYTSSQIADLIKEYEEEYGWTFSFIGANIDVESLSKELNISEGNTLNFCASPEGTSKMMETYSTSVQNYYSDVKRGVDVKAKKDFIAK